jgi:hypothetical protein
MAQADPATNGSTGIMEASEKIPALTNISPSIFVPLPDIDFDNWEPPRNRVERLEHILKTIDHHNAEIHKNLLYMFEREKRRLVQQAAEYEQFLLGSQPPDPKSRPGLIPEEIDNVINNMAAPAEKDVDYNVNDIEEELREFEKRLQELTPGPTPITPAPAPGTSAHVRDETVKALLFMVKQAGKDLYGCEEFLKTTRGKYLDLLEKEKIQLEEVGMRPEERMASRGQ